MTKKINVIVEGQGNQNDEAKEKLKKRRKDFAKKWENASGRERGEIVFNLGLETRLRARKNNSKIITLIQTMRKNE